MNEYENAWKGKMNGKKKKEICVIGRMSLGTVM